jgi:hypothetical protein
MPYSPPICFRQKAATAVVSLGYSCALAHNLRRYFAVDEAFPFDWWVTPATAVVGVLQRPDPDWLYDPEYLKLVDNGNSVEHSELGILYHHEFPRDPDGLVVINFLELIAEPKARAAYLLNRLLSADHSDARILFLRAFLPGEDCAPIRACLSERFRRATWTLATIPHILEGPPHGWQGNPAVWDAALERSVSQSGA